MGSRLTSAILVHKDYIGAETGTRVFFDRYPGPEFLTSRTIGGEVLTIAFNWEEGRRSDVL